MSFQNMADFLTGTPGINALEALNFDGGGSSTMVVDGVLGRIPQPALSAE
jgi:exopolysaccharide biosynthesis protein